MFLPVYFLTKNYANENLLPQYLYSLDSERKIGF